MSPSRSKSLKIALGTLVVILILAWVLSKSGISADKAAQAITAFGPQALLASFVLCCVQVLGMILRTQYLFTKSLDPGFGGVAYAISVGQAVNTFLPARAGDVLKAILFGKAATRSVRPTPLQGAGVLVADRVLDISSLIMIVLLSGAYRMPGVQLPKLPTLGAYSWVIGGVAAIVAIALFLVVRRNLHSVRRWLYEMRDGLAGLFDAKRTTLSLLVAMGAWAAEAGSLEVLARAQGIPVGFSQAMFILVVLNLAIAVPVSVANVGAFEASIIFALGSLGGTMEQGLAVATVHHAMQLAAISTWALGMMWLFRNRVHWRGGQ